MSENILTSFNWLDVLMVLVMIGTVFRGAVCGFVVEFFKIFGIVFATVLALHFYVRAAGQLQDFISLPENVAEILSCIAIAAVVILIFKFIREGWLLILKSESKASLSQWAGGLTAIFRSFFVCGLIFFFIFLGASETLNAFAEKSVIGSYFCDLSPKVYKMTYEGILQKFFPEEQLNTKAFKTVKKESVLKM